METVTAELATRRALVLTVAAADAQADLGLECWGASRKADVLAKLLERDVVSREITGWAGMGRPAMALTTCSASRPTPWIIVDDIA